MHKIIMFTVYIYTSRLNVLTFFITRNGIFYIKCNRKRYVLPYGFNIRVVYCIETCIDNNMYNVNYFIRDLKKRSNSLIKNFSDKKY